MNGNVLNYVSGYLTEHLGRILMLKSKYNKQNHVKICSQILIEWTLLGVLDM